MTVKQWCLAGLRYALMLCGLVFLVQLAAPHLTSWWSSDADQPQYLFATVAQGPLETLVSSTGTLAALETVEVGTQVSGTIARLEVDYNDHVRKGQVLAVLDQALFAAQVQEAEANVAKARATLTQAEDEQRRNQPLFDKGFLSAQEFLPISTGVNTARAALAAAEASLTRARTNLAYTVIRSPIDGTVIKRSIEAGQTVAASLNTPTLFLIARDLAQMQIEADVDESDIGQIRTGQPVRFTVQSHPDETFQGRVSQVRLQPRTISNVVNYTVLVEASNDKGLLLPGMTATIDFVVNRLENALLVPNAALRFQPQEETPGTNRRSARFRQRCGGREGRPALHPRRGRPPAEPAGDQGGERRDQDCDQRCRPSRGAAGGQRSQAGGEGRQGELLLVPPPAAPRRRLALSLRRSMETIVLRDLGRTFAMGDTAVHALREVSLTIARGEFVAIMGASGSGKSTLMNLLGCLDQPTGGDYCLDGIQVSRLDRRQLADIRNQKIGFVFQGFNLLPRTSALENVELPLLYDRSGRIADPRRQALAVLDQVGLGDRVHHEPARLSGGQQQRVAIARALVNNPAILLADEPTGNLDTRTSVEVMAVFQGLNARGMTVLLVTHEPDIACYAKRIIELRDGRVVRDEPVAAPRQADSDLQAWPENGSVTGSGRS